MHGAGAAEIAKEALIIGAADDIEAADGVAIAVKGASVLVDAGADWGPGISFLSADLAEVDIGGEDGVGGRFAVLVDELGKFPQLLGGSNLVHAIAVFLQPSPLSTL